MSEQIELRNVTEIENGINVDIEFRGKWVTFTARESDCSKHGKVIYEAAKKWLEQRRS